MIWFFHSNGTETSISRASRATANSAPVNIGAAARRKIPSNGGFSISNLNQGMTCARPRTLLRRRPSRAFSAATRPFGSNREGNSARNKNERRRREAILSPDQYQRARRKGQTLARQRLDGCRIRRNKLS